MPDRTSCPRCKKTGFVRFEMVIKAGDSRRHYYCGACGHEWQVAGDGSEKSAPDPRDRPDRSRPS